MLKRKVLKRISILLCCLLIIGIIYIFPSTKDTEKDVSFIKQEDTDVIYLIDNNDYVARVNVVLNNDDILEKTKEIISYLTVGSDNSDYIRKGFKPIIPKNTLIIDLSFSEGILKINFSKELLNIDKKNEQKMIEALVYSLTEIKSVNSISIFVEGKILDKMPHSKISLPTTLDRNFGINKIYNLERLKDSTKTTIYYISKYDDFYYYVPVTKVNNEKSEKIEIIIKELTSSSLVETNLMSYLASSTELLNYTKTEESLVLNFNDQIFADTNSNEILEEVVYSINLSIDDNYDVKSVMYLVDDNIVDSYILH